MQTLEQGFLLQGGRYRIEKVLGQGGFGITYLAEECASGKNVAIKEFFMKTFCERDEKTSRVALGTKGNHEFVERFRVKFVKEAHSLMRLRHTNIVKVCDIFEENGTAYYVMEYASGGSLADLVKRKGCLTEADATRYILQVADALAYIHREKMNHLDIKPANILLNDKDEAILIDFGLSKQYDAITGSQTSTTPVGISEGYAPMEQYKQGGVGEFSPETDIYALGATFFKLLTGKTPPSALDLLNERFPVGELKAKGVSATTIKVIREAMKPRKKNRMKDIHLFIDGLSNPVSSAQSEVSQDVNNVSEDTVLLGNDIAEGSTAENANTLIVKKKKVGTPKTKAMKSVGRVNTVRRKTRTVGKKDDFNGCASSFLCFLEVAAFFLCVFGVWFVVEKKLIDGSQHDVVQKIKVFLILVLIPWGKRIWHKLFD